MASIWHNIKVWLYLNLLTQNNPNDYVARVASDRTLNIQDICRAAVERGGSDISIAAMKHAVELFFKEMAYQLCDGFAVNTGWFVASVHIKGVFDSPLDIFDPKRHTVVIEFHQGSLLRNELQNITVEVLGVAETGVLIAQVIDVKSGTVNDLLTPNRNLKIAGYKLKIAGENADNGVYFIDEQGAKTKVDSSDIVTNNPSELIIVTPELSAGTYHLSVTTQFSGSGGKVLNEPRTTTFNIPLTVQ
jgi:hypothetical protein